MRTTLEWLGVSTFRLTVGETVIFLDAYMDRIAAAPPVGLSAKDVGRADWILVGHSHFDHLAGAEVIAAATGAKIIGSTETARVMLERGIPAEQLVVSHGGEHHRLTPEITVRVFPSLHACTWIHSFDPAIAETGHLGLTEDERGTLHGLTQEIVAFVRSGTPEAAEMRQHITTSAGSIDHGGALAYYIETPSGSIFYQDTSGCWTGTLNLVNPDVAILAASGRANVDGEPIQGSVADLIAMEADMMRPSSVVLAHHDDWMPPVTKPVDPAPIRAALARRVPTTTLIAPTYLDPISLFE